MRLLSYASLENPDAQNRNVFTSNQHGRGWLFWWFRYRSAAYYCLITTKSQDWVTRADGVHINEYECVILCQCALALHGHQWRNSQSSMKITRGMVHQDQGFGKERKYLQRKQNENAPGIYQPPPLLPWGLAPYPNSAIHRFKMCGSSSHQVGYYTGTNAFASWLFRQIMGHRAKLDTRYMQNGALSFTHFQDTQGPSFDQAIAWSNCRLERTGQRNMIKWMQKYFIQHPKASPQ